MADRSEKQLAKMEPVMDNAWLTDFALGSWADAERHLQGGNGCFLLPVGSIEQHGSGPLATDVIIACVIAREVAQRSSAMVAPPVAFGYSHIHSAFPGTITISPETMTNLVYEIVEQVSRQGFTRCVIVNGHGSNSVWLGPLAQRVTANIRDVELLTFEWWKEPSVKAYEEEMFGAENGDHANCSEFSILAHLFPDRPLPPPVHDCRPWKDGEVSGPLEFRSLYPTGVVGANLALVDAEHGKQLLSLAVNALMSELPGANCPM